MAHSDDGAILRNLRAIFDAGASGGLSDAQLLARFLARHGEAAELAFAALVARHGPMVLRACRAALSDEHDAQDAFQATFLVLARRAGSLWVRDSLGPWLHATALRVAAVARSARARRRAHEREAAARAVETSGTPAFDDLGAALHEELGRLPARERAAVVLCYLEGRTCEEAARDLGCPAGTIKSRLAAARARLRERLARRGLAPTIGAMGAFLAAKGAPAAVPAALAETTARAAACVAAGHAAAGVASTAAAALTEGVMKAMIWTKLKASLAGAAALGSAVGMIALAQESAAPSAALAPTASFAPEAQDAGKTAPVAEGAGGDRLREVEAKLDRVLQALEGNPRPLPNPAGTAGAGVPRPSSVPTLAESGDAGGRGVSATPTLSRVQVVSTPTLFPTPGPPADRLTTVERRLEQLERRLEQLERRLDGAASPGSAPVAFPTPGGGASPTTIPTPEGR